MGLETVTHISDLVVTNPVGPTDIIQYGDDHIRNIKVALKTDFPNITGAMTATQAELNILDGATLSTAELNVLDGYTGNTADLNILAGADAAGLTATEIQYVNGVTSAIQTQLNAKLATANQAMVFLSTQAASSSASIAITSDISSTYDVYIVEGYGVVPATDATNLQLLVSTDGGSTYVTSTDYIYATKYVAASGTDSVYTSTGDSSYKVAETVSNTASLGGVNFTLKFYLPSNTSLRKAFLWELDYHNGTNFITARGGGHCSAAAVVTGNIDAIKFQFSSGNIASGTFTLYGMRKS